MKSGPKNNDLMPGILNNDVAKGEDFVGEFDRNSSVPFVFPITGTPGMNFNASGFGVVSVWMKIDLEFGRVDKGLRILGARERSRE